MAQRWSLFSRFVNCHAIGIATLWNAVLTHPPHRTYSIIFCSLSQWTAHHRAKNSNFASWSLSYFYPWASFWHFDSDTRMFPQLLSVRQSIFSFSHAMTLSHCRTITTASFHAAIQTANNLCVSLTAKIRARAIDRFERAKEGASIGEVQAKASARADECTLSLELPGEQMRDGHCMRQSEWRVLHHPTTNALSSLFKVCLSRSNMFQVFYTCFETLAMWLCRGLCQPCLRAHAIKTLLNNLHTRTCLHIFAASNTLASIYRCYYQMPARVNRRDKALVTKFVSECKSTCQCYGDAVGVVSRVE